MTQHRRLYLWLTIAVAVGVGLLFAFWPRAVSVDMIAVAPGPMMLTVGSEGETRVKDVFVVSAPTSGRLRRVEAEPGDQVVANETVIVEIEPVEVDLLDPRSEAEAQATLSAAISAEALARAEFEKADADLGFATAELNRAKELAPKGTISARELEAAERAYKTSRAALGVAQAAMQVRKFELERAQALLMTPQELHARRTLCDCFSITSPVNGQVLRILRESEGFVAAGEGLVEIGDPQQLEVVVDLLSIDAVKVQPGQSAIIDNWGGEQPLQARVRRVEPFGFTKTSALGIDEQRVYVVLDLVSPQGQWKRLGHGYQVDVDIILWQSESALKLPLTALFRDGNHWAVFVNENGRAVRRHVELGHRSASEAEVLSGLESGDAVVVYPGEAIDEGVRIAAR